MKAANPEFIQLDSIELTHYIVGRYKSVEHLKLQKLVYYLEGYHLAYFDKSLIEDNFQAWLHGPVSRKLYDYIKPTGANVYGSLSLTEPMDEQERMIKSVEAKLNPMQLELINDILSEFSPRSPYDLECLTHEELPWIEARRGYAPADRCEVEISKETMRTFYKEKLYVAKENKA
ncbi:MAG: hypothetical protein JWP12_2543 [Bacteroidetes bacterium]|nr:hypothetical protein [Bacteroidota bacterium]